MKTFTTYVHREYESGDKECWEGITKQLDVDISTDEQYDNFRAKFGQPFYEVELTCSYDEDTGEVKILHAKLN